MPFIKSTRNACSHSFTFSASAGMSSPPPTWWSNMARKSDFSKRRFQKWEHPMDSMREFLDVFFHWFSSNPSGWWFGTFFLFSYVLGGDTSHVWLMRWYLSLGWRIPTCSTTLQTPCVDVLPGGGRSEECVGHRCGHLRGTRVPGQCRTGLVSTQLKYAIVC